MEVVDRAIRARRLLSDEEVFNEAMSAVRDKLISGLENCAIGDIDTQHNLTLSLQLLKQLEGMLRRWIDEGTLEQAKTNRTGIFRKFAS